MVAAPLRRLVLTLPALLLARAGVASAATPVIYPMPGEDDHAWRYARADRYRLLLLREALARARRGYALAPAAHKMPQGRVIQELHRRGGAVDVMWTMTTTEREQMMIPVRIPLYEGLIGMRLLLVRRADLPLFAQVRTLADLRRLVAIQGHDWPDTDILRFNGLPVTTGSNYINLFSMLHSHRGDYFPRGVTEIWNEARSSAPLGAVVEPNLMLRYPAAMYFFVSPHQPELADDLRRGLEAMVADGSFGRLFHAYHDGYLHLAKLSGRRVIELDNPLLPAGTPLAHKELWWQP
jgi:hypothetical protein